MIDLPVLPRAGLRPSLKSAISRVILRGPGPLSRRRAGQALELYYEVGDAHSQLCAALARRMVDRLAVPLRIRLVPPPQPEAYPEADRQRAFALQDARRLADPLDLPAPLEIPEGQTAAMQNRLAEAGEDAARFLEVEAECLAALDSGLPPEKSDAQTSRLMQSNAARRERLGHYLPAMWQYRGEWFWALDRLDFLEARLRSRDVLRGPEELVELDPTRLDLPESVPDPELEFWFSFRSPYSYLAAVELLARAEAGRLPRVRVLPVLPMVMRGLAVPLAKRLYIVRDVKRCAEAMGIDFGRVHDPVGDGVLRLLTSFPREADSLTQLRFCALAGQSIWAEGLDFTRDEVLANLFQRCGLDWAPAQARLAQGIDTTEAEANRSQLFEAGLWGVPSFRLGDFVTWGQDRIWMIDEWCARELAGGEKESGDTMPPQDIPTDRD